MIQRKPFLYVLLALILPLVLSSSTLVQSAYDRGDPDMSTTTTTRSVTTQVTSVPENISLLPVFLLIVGIIAMYQRARTTGKT